MKFGLSREERKEREKPFWSLSEEEVVNLIIETEKYIKRFRQDPFLVIVRKELEQDLETLHTILLEFEYGKRRNPSTTK
tara:strand:+ start:12127 stop:12363 length:237 start_codon:yes stop_codon:yes gene_type:complete